MKKTKLIALTMVVALMMVGAGYAAWSDQLVVQGTVDTGRLDVQFVNISNDLEVDPDFHMNGRVDYEDVGDELMNKAVVTVNEVYPGSEFEVNLRVKNNSTMPVKLRAESISEVISAWSFLSPYVDCTMTLGNGTTINPINGTIPVNEVLNINFTVNVPLSLDEETLPEDTPFTATIHPVFEQFNDL